MTEVEYQKNYARWMREGISAVEEGNVRLATSLFEKVRQDDLSPLAQSYFAYCLAREKRSGGKAINMALHALRAEDTHPLIYLNLGRIYMVFGRVEKALQVYRRGLKYQHHALLLKQLDNLCPRQRCTFPFLKRSHPLNMFTGRLRVCLLPSC